jgi:PPOX class probable F420-dependent enzyme
VTDYPPGSGPPPKLLTEADALAAIAATRQGILATVNRAGYPHLTNMIYTWDEPTRTALFMTTAERVKVRHLRNNPHAALHVSGGDFWSFVVAQGEAELSEPSTVPGDAVGQELLLLHPEIQEHDRAAFFKQMVVDQRLLIRLKVTKFYGTALDI